MVHPADFYEEVCTGQHCRECEDCKDGECSRDEWEAMKHQLWWEQKDRKECRK